MNSRDKPQTEKLDSNVFYCCLNIGINARCTTTHKTFRLDLDLGYTPALFYSVLATLLFQEDFAFRFNLEAKYRIFLTFSPVWLGSSELHASLYASSTFITNSWKEEKNQETHTHPPHRHTFLWHLARFDSFLALHAFSLSLPLFLRSCFAIKITIDSRDSFETFTHRQR